MWLTRAALTHPIAVTLFYVAIALVGWIALASMGRGLLPNVEIPSIAVTAAYPGASPREIEQLVVKPIEDALDTVPNIERVTSSSQSGFAQVVAQFRFGIDVREAQSDVQQALDGARGNMPADLLPPVVVRDDPTQIPVIEFAVSSAVFDRAKLAAALDREILPALRAAPGVGVVRVGGEWQRAFIVTPQRSALAALGGTDLDVLRAMTGASDVFPGGFEHVGGTQASVGVRADATSAQELGAIPVSLGAGAVSAGNLARITDGSYDPTTIASYDGNNAVILLVTRAAGADTMRTIASVRAVSARLRGREPLVRIVEVHSDAAFAQAAIAGVQRTLFEGIALTALTMLLFLHVWRNAVVAGLAIPASLLACCIVMWVLGFSINVLSLMGLSITIGILVDDSIVIIEAIARARARGLQGDAAALAGRAELGPAAIAITLVDVVVFAPIALIGGIVGEFMRQFAAVVVISTAFSLLVSFTLTPLLCARWASVRREPKRLPWTLRTRLATDVAQAYHAVLDGFAHGERSVERIYAEQLLPFVWRRRRIVLGAAFAICLLAFAPLFAGAIPTEFSPPTDRGTVTLTLREPSGTAIERTDADARRFADRLLDDARVRDATTTVGLAFDGTQDVFASNLAEVTLELSDPASDGAAVERVTRALGGLVPGVAIERAGRGMGGTAPIVYRIAGNPALLPQAASNVSALLASDPLLADVRRSDVGVAPHLELRVDSTRARQLGVAADDVAQTARMATGGELATRTRTPDGLVDVLVRDDALRNGNRDRLAAIDVRAGAGMLVPLSALLRVRASNEPLVLEREDRAQIVTVSANPIDGIAVGTAVAPIARKVASVLPTGTIIEPRGDLEQLAQTMLAILETLGLSMLLVYAILAVLYRSYSVPLIVMLTVPFATVGAFSLLSIVRSQSLNLYSMLGIVMLVGLVAKNGILLVDFAERAVREGVAAFEAAALAARRRFRPIVMTTCAMVFGMLPLALGDSAGAEYRKALGTVVIGGLLSSLVLTLVVLPVVYGMMRNRRGRERYFIAASETGEAVLPASPPRM
jgi:hydrophobic/amphiphilic exporter-1 (mainly G- bacteria), HAE1 family